MKTIVLRWGNRGSWQCYRRLCFAVLFIFIANYQPAWSGPQRHGIFVGVGAHLWNASRSEIDKQLGFAAKAGFTMIRWDAPWKAVEPVPGVLKVPSNWDYIVDSANRKGIASLLILDYGNAAYDGADKPRSSQAIAGFARYAKIMVQHFEGRVAYYELWNEWDGTTGGTTPGTPESYIAFIRAVYPAIKKVSRTATVLVGGTTNGSYESIIGFTDRYGPERAGFFESLLHLGLLNYADAISIHPYVMGMKGCAQTGVGAYHYVSAIVNKIRKSNGGRRIPVFITEIGWPIGEWKEISRIDSAEQSKYLVNALQLTSKLSGVAGFLIYQLKDPNSNPLDKESNFGLMTVANRPKASYEAIRDYLTSPSRSASYGFKSAAVCP